MKRMSNTKQREGAEKSRRSLRILWALLLVSFLSIGIFSTHGVNAGAANKHLGGHFTAPLGETLPLLTVEDDGSDEEVVEPEELDINLDTGDHYKYLTEGSKVIYQALYKAITAGKVVPYGENVNLPKEYTKDATFKKYAYVFSKGNAFSVENPNYAQAMEALYYDHPGQLEFYMCGVLLSGTYNRAGQNYNWIIVQNNYNVADYTNLNSQLQAALNQEVAEIKQDIGTNTHPAWVEFKAHADFATEVEYDDSCYNLGDNGYYNLSHTAYNALVKDTAVCDGYSAAFQLIMEKLGIDSMVITGHADPEREGKWGGHAWNIVKPQADWYEVDTTWAHIQNNKNDYMTTYFNRTTQDFSPDHRRTPNSFFSGYLMPIAYGTTFTIDTFDDYSDANLGDEPNYSPFTGITVSPATASVNVDDSIVLDVTLQTAKGSIPNAAKQNYTITSSNPNVAFVSGNAVTGISAGTATITAATKNGLSATATITVTVPVGMEISDAQGNEYEVIAGNQVALKSIEDNTSGTVTIADSFVIGGVEYKVTTIPANLFKGNKNIKTVKGGNNLTTIGANAFSGCKAMTSVNITSPNLKTIGKKAFYNCKKLKKVTLNGNSLKTVKGKAFTNIKKGAKITIKIKSKSKFDKLVSKLKKAGASSATYKKKK